MAVIAVWKCDRDGTMFDEKKQAEEHDKMLELAANITGLIEQHIKGVDENHSEAIGLLLAKRKDDLAKACKGKPEVLLESASTPTVRSAIGVSDTTTTEDSDGENITSIARQA